MGWGKIFENFVSIFPPIMMCRFQKYKKKNFENFYSTKPAPMVMGPPMGAPMTIGAGSMGMELPRGQ